MRVTNRIAAALCVAACAAVLPSLQDRAAPTARAAVHYHNFSDGYFGVIVPDGWLVSDGRNGIEVSSPTGAVRYEYAYAYGGIVGQYTLGQLSNLTIGTLGLQGRRLLRGPVTAIEGPGWHVRTTELQGHRQGQLVHALVAVQILDNVDGEAIIGESMSAPAVQWRAVLPELSMVRKSLRVLG